jgi:hypothetical protein
VLGVAVVVSPVGWTPMGSARVKGRSKAKKMTESVVRIFPE